MDFTRKLLNFNCIFPTCDFKQNNIEEKEFLEHLKQKHDNEMIDIAKKETIPKIVKGDAMYILSEMQFQVDNLDFKELTKRITQSGIRKMD